MQTAAPTPLNLPKPVHVVPSATPDGPVPGQIGYRGRLYPVTTIEEEIRVVDEWWRPEPADRHYFICRMGDGRRLTVFWDAINDRWYEQRY